MRRSFVFSAAVVLAAACPLFAAHVADAGTVVGPNCTYKGKVLKGKVKVVKSFPDIKVQKVKSFPDLKVQKVKAFPDKCGQWQFVDSFPDFTIQYVDSFPDIKVMMVDSFPGRP